MSIVKTGNTFVRHIKELKDFVRSPAIYVKLFQMKVYSLIRHHLEITLSITLIEFYLPKSQSISSLDEDQATQATKKPKQADDYEVYEEETMKGNFKHLLERHECDRICKKGEQQKICHYELHVSEYTTMGKVNIIL